MKRKYINLLLIIALFFSSSVFSQTYRLPPNSKLQIFNRWGNSVYQSNDYQNNWTTEVDGVYYYVLLVHEQEYKGFVQVLTN